MLQQELKLREAMSDSKNPNQYVLIENGIAKMRSSVYTCLAVAGST